MARRKATRRKTTKKKTTRRKSTPRRASRTSRKKPTTMTKWIVLLGLLAILAGAFTSFLSIEWGIIIAIVFWLFAGLMKK